MTVWVLIFLLILAIIVVLSRADARRAQKAADAGRPDTLPALRAAVEAYRRAAREDPARFEPDLAASLHNLATRLSRSGERDAALAAIREAVAIWRRLARADPGDSEPYLAASLHNLSSRLRELGDRDGALEATREAVAIRRRLAEADPARLESDLVASLNALSSVLADAGHRDGALAAVREATEVSRRLARAHPAEFGPDLALTLRYLSIHLEDVGDHHGACAAIREAGEIRRRLLRKNRPRLMRQAPEKPHWRARIYVWIGLRAAESSRIDGLWVGVRQPATRQPIAVALDLIKQYDPLRYNRLTRDLERLWVTVLVGPRGSFNPSLKLCSIDERFVAAEAARPELIAATIVHEATHARLMRCGIGYEEELRARVEAVCFRRERAFAARLPNGRAVCEQAELELTDPPDNWSRAAIEKRYNENVDAALRHIGLSGWQIRVIRAVRSLDGRLRRFTRPW